MKRFLIGAFAVGVLALLPSVSEARSRHGYYDRGGHSRYGGGYHRHHGHYDGYRHRGRSSLSFSFGYSSYSRPYYDGYYGGGYPRHHYHRPYHYRPYYRTSYYSYSPPPVVYYEPAAVYCPPPRYYHPRSYYYPRSSFSFGFGYRYYR